MTIGVSQLSDGIYILNLYGSGKILESKKVVVNNF